MILEPQMLLTWHLAGAPLICDLSDILVSHCVRGGYFLSLVKPVYHGLLVHRSESSQSCLVVSSAHGTSKKPAIWLSVWGHVEHPVPLTWCHESLGLWIMKGFLRPKPDQGGKVQPSTGQRPRLWHPAIQTWVQAQACPLAWWVTLNSLLKLSKPHFSHNNLWYEQLYSSA